MGLTILGLHLRNCGSNLGNQIAFSMTITTNISMSILDSTLSYGTRYTGPSGRRTRYTERTSSGGRGRISLIPQGKSWKLTLEKEKMKTLLHMIATKINTCDQKKKKNFLQKKKKKKKKKS